MATSKKTRKTSRKTSKKAASKKATGKKASTKKAAKQANGRDSMASFMSALAASGKSAEAMHKALKAEAKKRGLDPDTYTWGRLRGHVKFRQSKGQLKGVKLPEFKQS